MNKIITTIGVATCVWTAALTGSALDRARDQRPRPAAKPKIAPEDARLQEAQQLAANGDIGAASAVAMKALDDFPASASVHEKVYQLLRGWQRHEEAQRTLDVTLERFPTDVSVLQRVAAAPVDPKDLPAAEQRLRRALQNAGDDRVKGELTTALDAVVARRAELARREAEADDKRATLAIIERRIADSGFAEAAKELAKLLTTYPADDELSFAAHDLFAKMGRFDEAEKYLTDSIQRATDPEVARTRRLQVRALAYRKEQAIEAARRQAINVRLKKMALLIEDGKSAQALGDVEALLKEYPKDGFVQAGAHTIYAQAGDFVAAEYHLKAALDLAADQESKNAAELQLVELNHRREKRAEDVAADADTKIRNGKYAEAVASLRDLDKITLYHRAAYITRAGLLGIYRKYEEAVKVYTRILQDPRVDAERKRVEQLRDYCIRQVTAKLAAPKDAHYCPFCGARQVPGAAYCHVCLSFQHPVAEISGKKERSTFTYAQGRLSKVRYAWENGHGVSNAFAGIMGGIAAGASKSAVDVSYRNSEQVFRAFAFRYDGNTPESVSFSSSASGGEVETFRLDGATTLSYKTREEGGRDESASLQDIFVYPTHPVIDPVFAGRAFGQSIHRGFAPNVDFDPFVWSQPSLFVLIYDDQGRLTRAVDAYEYGGGTSAGHLQVKGRKNFTGAGARDPLQEPSYIEVTYNPQGLIASLRRMSGDRDVWKRELTYGPAGITAERTTAQRRVVGETSYKWEGTLLVSAEHKLNGDKDDIRFAPPLPTQYALTVDAATATQADYLQVAARLGAIERYDAALACLNQGLTKFPSEPQLFLARGDLSMQMKAPDAAKADFLKFLALAPKAPAAKAVRNRLKVIDPKLKT